MKNIYEQGKRQSNRFQKYYLSTIYLLPKLNRINRNNEKLCRIVKYMKIGTDLVRRHYSWGFLGIMGLAGDRVDRTCGRSACRRHLSLFLLLLELFFLLFLLQKLLRSQAHSFLVLRPSSSYLLQANVLWRMDDFGCGTGGRYHRRL